ncbi:MAG: hypothetical protein R6X32_15710, partial [Chloroflexota bacterium]
LPASGQAQGPPHHSAVPLKIYQAAGGQPSAHQGLHLVAGWFTMRRAWKTEGHAKAGLRPLSRLSPTQMSAAPANSVSGPDR